jgi:hypothetical protein
MEELENDITVISINFGMQFVNELHILESDGRVRK